MLFYFWYFFYFLACLILKISPYLCTFFLMYICMIINGLQNFFSPLESTSPLRKIKSLFWNLVANNNLFCPFFLEYNLTYILRFAIYDWLTKHSVFPLVNSRITLTLRGLNFICCFFTWKLIIYIDYMWLLFLLTFVFIDLYFLHGLFRCLETKL